MTTNVQETTCWWGNYNLQSGKNRVWRIGPLTFSVCCFSNEWQVAYERLEQCNDDDSSWESIDAGQDHEKLGNNARYVFRETSGLLTITPRLADRPVISRPNTPFTLVAGEETTLYVSTPLWIELGVGKTPKQITELSIQRPSDTWFGPSTREGELCYTSTTHCRLNLNELPQRPHRAITPLIIRNLADSSLLIERLKVTTPILPLYVDSDQQLWTPTVTLIRKQDGEVAELKIDTNPPETSKTALLVSKPRITQSSGSLIRAFNTVFRY